MLREFVTVGGGLMGCKIAWRIRGFLVISRLGF